MLFSAANMSLLVADAADPSSAAGCD
eukprot:SAG31_NODE_6480_length_2000_cov_1.640568_1_plen_25_part_10